MFRVASFPVSQSCLEGIPGLVMSCVGDVKVLFRCWEDWRRG